MSYEDYLKSEHWKNKKAEMAVLRKKRCFLCRRYRYLQLHHISYKNVGKETVKDLVWLCVTCHKANHFGKDKEKIQKWIKENANKVEEVTRKHGQRIGESLFAFKVRMKKLQTRNYLRKRKQNERVKQTN